MATKLVVVGFMKAMFPEVLCILVKEPVRSIQFKNSVETSV